jgi:hypothetical protein
MKKVFLKAFAALVLLTLSQFASAVCYRSLNDVPPGGPGLFSINGMFCTENVRPEQQGVAAPRVIYSNPHPNYGIAPPAYPQAYLGGAPSSGGLSNCAIVGGVAGATLGSLARNHRAQAVILGGLLGGVAGSMVCTDSRGQRVTVPQQVVYPPRTTIIPAEQQVGGFETNNFANPGYLPRQAPMEPPVRGVFCNIDGVVTKEANNAACEAKALQKAEGLIPQTQLQSSAGSGAGTKVMSSSKAPVCGTGKTWGRLNWEGHPQHNTYACLPADAPRFPAD